MIRSHSHALGARRIPAVLAAALVVASASPSEAAAQTAPDATSAVTATSADTVPLYERLGGYDVIASFVGLVFPRVANHPELVHLFRGHGLDSQRRQFQLVVEMVCNATGGPCLYLGRDMERVHDGLGITDELWTVFMGIIDEGIREVGMAEAEAHDFRAMWLGFRPGVVRPGPE